MGRNYFKYKKMTKFRSLSDSSGDCVCEGERERERERRLVRE